MLGAPGVMASPFAAAMPGLGGAPLTAYGAPSAAAAAAGMLLHAFHTNISLVASVVVSPVVYPLWCIYVCNTWLSAQNAHSYPLDYQEKF